MPIEQMPANDVRARFRVVSVPSDTAGPPVAVPWTVLSVDARLFRLEFWSDARWLAHAPEDRPEGAMRAHSDDGYFLVTPLSPDQARSLFRD